MGGAHAPTKIWQLVQLVTSTSLEASRMNTLRDGQAGEREACLIWRKSMQRSGGYKEGDHRWVLLPTHGWTPAHLHSSRFLIAKLSLQAGTVQAGWVRIKWQARPAAAGRRPPAALPSLLIGPGQLQHASGASAAAGQPQQRHDPLL